MQVVPTQTPGNGGIVPPWLRKLDETSVDDRLTCRPVRLYERTTYLGAHSDELAGVQMVELAAGLVTRTVKLDTLVFVHARVGV